MHRDAFSEAALRERSRLSAPPDHPTVQARMRRSNGTTKWSSTCPGNPGAPRMPPNKSATSRRRVMSSTRSEERGEEGVRFTLSPSCRDRAVPVCSSADKSKTHGHWQNPNDSRLYGSCIDGQNPDPCSLDAVFRLDAHPAPLSSSPGTLARADVPQIVWKGSTNLGCASSACTEPYTGSDPAFIGQDWQRTYVVCREWSALGLA